MAYFPPIDFCKQYQLEILIKEKEKEFQRKAAQHADESEASMGFDLSPRTRRTTAPQKKSFFRRLFRK